MATVELDPSARYSEQSLSMQGNFLRRLVVPAIRWGAVFAGVAVGVSVQLILTLLGIASGLSAIDVSSSTSVGNGPLLWAGLSMLVSAFVGGYMTARMSGLKRKMDGVLHGAVSWAVTILLFTMLATSAGGTLLSGVFSNLSPDMMAQGANSDTSVSALLRGAVAGNADPSALQSALQQVRAGRRDEAINTLTQMGVESERANAIVDQALILSGSPEQASPQSRSTANRALQAAGTAAWVMFAAVALSLALALIGGLLGAVGARRTTWTDTSVVKRTVPRKNVPVRSEEE